MSDSSSSSSAPLPVPEQEVLLPPTDDPSSPSSSSSGDDDDDVDDGDRVVAIATHGGGEQQGLMRWLLGSGGRGHPTMGGMPPAPALFVPWPVPGGGGAPAASIEALPTVEVSEHGAVCAICKDDLPVAAAARRLPCGHLYHSPCVVPWLEVHNSCPICRCRLPPPPAPEPEQDPAPPAAPAGTDDHLQLPGEAVSSVVSGEGEERIIVRSVGV